MNEITKIHLGRQVFVIALDAYKALQNYVHAITDQVGSTHEDVVTEVELRMAELLAERGIQGEKAVLLKDVEWLKEQLGSPQDFADEDTGHTTNDHDEKQQGERMPKRLFRDTDNAMLAGVCAGLARYTGIDVAIIRLIFIILIFFGAAGILIYLVLWLLVPEATTKSEKLQMQGRPVTIGTIKEVVAKTNVSDVAKHASHTARRAVEAVGKIVRIATGIGFLVVGSATFLGAVTAGIYLLSNGAYAYDSRIFPVGASEAWIVVCGVVAVVAFSLLLVLTGTSLVRRKWSFPGWVVAVLVSVVLTGVSVGAALAIGRAPEITTRMNKLRHTQHVAVAPFTKLDIQGEQSNITFEQSATYGVEITYMGNKLWEDATVVHVQDGVLAIDTSTVHNEDCWFICLGGERWVEVIVRGPAIDTITLAGYSTNFTARQLTAENLALNLSENAQVNLFEVYADRADITMVPNRATVHLSGVRAGAFDEAFSASPSYASFKGVDYLQLATPGACDPLSPLVVMNDMPKELRINNLPAITTLGQLNTAQQVPEQQPSESLPVPTNYYNCVEVLNVR